MINKKHILLASCVGIGVMSYNALSATNRVFLGTQAFCIPKELSILDLTTRPAFSLLRADKNTTGGSVQIAIDAPEAASGIAGYQSMHGDLAAPLIINMRTGSPESLESIKQSSAFANLLQLTGKYETAPLEFDEEQGIYRVSPWEHPPPFVIWHALSLKPDKEAKLPSSLDDYYLGYCSNAGGTTGVNGTSTICDYRVAIDEFEVKVITTENNLHLKKNINDYIENKLDSWSKACGE